MKKNRILAIIMAIFMVLSLLPSMVFAAEGGILLDGKVKIKGLVAVGEELSADYTKVLPDGITDDDVSFLWSLKKNEEEEPVELSREKKYKVAETDFGYKIVLTITGLPERGYSGELKVISYDVQLTKEEAEIVAAQVAAEEAELEAALQEMFVEEVPVEEILIEEIPMEEVIPEEIPAAEEPLQEFVEDEYTEETVEEEVYDETYDETYESQEFIEEGYSETMNWDEEVWESPSPDDSGQVDELIPVPDQEDVGTDSETPDDWMLEAENEELFEVTITDSTEESGEGTEINQEPLTYLAQAFTEDETGILDFGTVIDGEESDAPVQYVTVKNTGTGTLNFIGISPEHFMVQDITEPLEPGVSATLWIQPRESVTPGTYEDTITYTSNEGANASVIAKVVVVEPESSPTPTPEGEGTPTPTPEGEETPTPTPEGEETPTPTPEGEGTPTPTPEGEETPTPTPEGEGTQTPAPTVTVEPTPSPVISAQADPAEVTFDSVEEGYGEIAKKNVTITNTGNVAFTIGNVAYQDINGDALGRESAFVIEGAITGVTVEPGQTLTFAVVPKIGLTAGTWEEMFAVYDNQATPSLLTTVTLRFPVRVKTVYGLTADKAALDFGSLESGYTAAPGSQTITVTNSGNTIVTLKQPGASSFVVGALSAVELSPGAQAAFSVQPKTGLAEGAYQEDIIIETHEGVSASVYASFIVSKSTIKLEALQKLSDITGLANGTKKTAAGLRLPSTIYIRTSSGNLKANVTWDVEGCLYNPAAIEKQTFKVSGTVTLPNGIENPNNIGLKTSVNVSVNAYSPKAASKDQNKISGIVPQGYTTQSRISFTAVGAGMENANPRKGDTRFVPASWTVINTNAWSAAPYTATFGITQAGDYSLTVVYNEQKYDGTNWVSTGVQDSKKVTFNIAQASVTGVPGQDLTPAAVATNANQKNAVKTGDNTMVLPFVIALVAAVGCITGVIVYKKKK